MIVLVIYVVIGIAFQNAATGVKERGGEYLGNGLPLNAMCLSFILFLVYSKKMIPTSIFVKPDSVRRYTNRSWPSKTIPSTTPF